MIQIRVLQACSQQRRQSDSVVALAQHEFTRSKFKVTRAMVDDMKTRHTRLLTSRDLPAAIIVTSSPKCTPIETCQGVEAFTFSSTGKHGSNLQSGHHKAAMENEEPNLIGKKHPKSRCGIVS